MTEHDEQWPPAGPADEAAPESSPVEGVDAGGGEHGEHVTGGDPRIAAAVARLDALGERPPAEHVEVYEDVHRVLQDALADAQADGRPGDPDDRRQ